MCNMLVELNKDDLVTLVLGCDPYYDLINKYSKLKYGNWTGGFVDKWSWNKYTLKELSEDTLYQIFVECKESGSKKLNV